MSAPGFATTHWSRVLRAGSEDPEQARAALAELCAGYRRPLEAFLRRSGCDASAAEELTQQFIAVDLVEKNALRRVCREDRRFRSWLLGALKHRVANERRRQMAEKRGGGAQHVSLAADDEALLASLGSRSPSPDELYDREFAVTLLGRALARVEAAYLKRGDTKGFEVLKDLMPGVRETRGYESAAQELGLEPPALRKAAGRLRARIGEAVRAEVKETLEVGESVEDEIRQLQVALQGGPA